MSIHFFKNSLSFLFFLFILIPINANSAAPPILNFSDLTSGPSTGLGDGKGSGVIVTVWGQNLGNSQGSSKIEFCDSENICRSGYVYYWKNADGVLPSGPANLYESHRMQEIAFSIPQSEKGNGIIKLTVNDLESTLPFTIRDGNIYHVMPTGNDTSGDGSFNKPWLTVAKADGSNGAPAGSTLYIHNMLTGSETTDIAIFADGVINTSDAPFSYIAYPNSRAEFWAYNGFKGYASGGDVVGYIQSKLSFFVSNNDEDANGQPVNKRNSTTFGIFGSASGRTVGNFITDTHPSDTTGGCPTGYSAALTSNILAGDKVSNWKVFGNQIKDYGCNGTNKQQHTMYFSIRDSSGDFNKPAPEAAYNYLLDNKAAGGVRYYDEDLSGNNNCGQFNTTFKMHNNVVVNQAGEGIAIGARCNVSTTFEIFNNVVINAGLKSEWNPSTGTAKGSHTDAVFLNPGSAQTSDIYFYNNTFYDWNRDGGTNGTQACVGYDSQNTVMNIYWNDNICYATGDRYFLRSNYRGTSLQLRTTGEGNVWLANSTVQKKAISPDWDASKITSDPLLSVNDSQIIISAGSPIINQSKSNLTKDIYGIPRKQTNTVGAVTAYDIKGLPKYPPGFNAAPILQQ